MIRLPLTARLPEALLPATAGMVRVSASDDSRPRTRGEPSGPHPGAAPVCTRHQEEEAAMPEPETDRRYRVIARRIDDSHPGAATLVHYAWASSVEGAVSRVRQKYERPGGVYGVGLYRVVSVEEETVTDTPTGDVTWTVDAIRAALGPLGPRFMHAVDRAPADRLPQLVARWQHIAADLEATIARGRELAAYDDRGEPMPGEVVNRCECGLGHGSVYDGSHATGHPTE